MSYTVEVFDRNPSLAGFAETREPVRYSKIHPDCVLYLITPWHVRGTKLPKRPLIVFIQGSGWTHPRPHMELPQLSMFARRGFVVASVIHRNAVEGHPFPAYLEDVKTAVRFLRAHADEYGIDENRVCAWGTSSGGNAALLLGLTPNDERYETREYADFSDEICAVVDFFGPTEIRELTRYPLEDPMWKEIFNGLAGKNDHEEVMRGMSPLYEVKNGVPCPPMLIVHGDADQLVPFRQSERMAERLSETGNEVTLVRVPGADHENDTWSEAVLERVYRFLKEKLNP